MRLRALSIVCIAALTATLHGCGRSRFTAPPVDDDSDTIPDGDQSGFSFDMVSQVQSAHSQVRPGSAGIEVDVLWENSGGDAYELVDQRLSFSSAGENVSADYTVTTSVAPSSIVPPGATARWRVHVAINPQAALGPVRLGAVSWFRDTQGRLREVLTRADGELVWQVTEDVVAITQLVPAATVMPGKFGAQVKVHVHNPTATAYDLLAMGLEFDRAGTDASADYSVSLAPSSPQILSAGATTILLLQVDVGNTAALGEVRLSASGEISEQGGPALALPPGDASTTWQVLSPEIVMVTTDADEDDTAGTPTVAAAGGVGDISLREALLIANGSALPQKIVFAPLLFVPAGSIVIAPSLGPLPELTADGTWISGGDALVILDGASLTSGSGLIVAANDITIDSLKLQTFPGSGVAVQTGNRADLRNLQLNSAPLHILAGAGHTVTDCAIRQRRSSLSVLSSNVVVRGCSMTGVNLAGTSTSFGIDGTGHIIEDNYGAEGDAGFRVSGTNIVVRNNILLFERDSIRVRGLFNGLLQGNRTTGPIDVQESTAVTIREGIFLSASNEIVLHPGSNEDVAPPVISYLAGAQVSGESSAEGGVVELYTTESPAIAVGTAAVTAGTWIADLPLGYASMKATVTTVGGSTSEFSAPFVQSSEALIVTSADDELDGGDSIFYIAQAGGDNDLSLREAITIANNRAGVDTITFDPSVFPPLTDTVIAIGAGSAGALPLPTITDGIMIDGAGSAVVLDADVLVPLPPIGILYNTSETFGVHNLTLRNFHGGEGGVIHSMAGGAHSISGNTIQCGDPSVSGIRIESRSAQMSVLANTVTGCGDGFYIFRSLAGIIERNISTDHTRSAMLLSSTRNLSVLDNDLARSSFGMRLLDCNDSWLVGNRVWDNFNSAISVDKLSNKISSGVQIEFNTLVTSQTGVHLVEYENIVVRNNIFAFNGSHGIGVAIGFGPASEEYNLYFENGADGSTGTNAVQTWLATALAPSDIFADPQLTNISIGDLTPQAAVFDAGLATGHDRNGDAVGDFLGAAPDIGALEIQ